MNIGTLSYPAFRRRLADGLVLGLPPYRVHVRSPLTRVAEGLYSLYRDYPIHLDEPCPDYRVTLDTPAWRRWWRPQVQFHFDGFTPFKPLPADQAHAMFEWGINWCVGNHDHTRVIVHAAVLERGGRALVLPGVPGAGKSTLTAALCQEGFRLLSDELCLIDPDTLHITPVPRPVSLKNASIPLIQQRYPKAVFSEAARDTLKGTVAHMQPPANAVLQASVPAAPGLIVFPRYLVGHATDWQALERHLAVLHCVEQSFNYNLHGTRGFATLVALAKASHCHRLHYSQLNEAIPLLQAQMDNWLAPTELAS